MSEFIYPAIIVERPHQFPATSWVANYRSDLEQAAHNDRASIEVLTAEEAHEELARQQREDGCVDEDLRDNLAAHPNSVFVYVGGRDWRYVASLEDAFLYILGHDLHAIDVIRTPEDFWRWCCDRACEYDVPPRYSTQHNTPQTCYRDIVKFLDLTEEVYDEEEDEYKTVWKHSTIDSWNAYLDTFKRKKS
jgi:hypothetical protein